MENTQSIDRIESIKANINQRDYSNCPDHLESDDPRKGGKVKTENDEDTEDRDNLLTEKLLLSKEAFSNESHVQKRSADPEVSLFESLRKKGYESISKLVRGFLHNKNGNPVTDKERSTVARNAIETMADQEHITRNS